jgi:hypothetical protein
MSPADSPFFRQPILVTGVPRSGTSLVAGLLATAGAWVGETVPGGRANPRGFFENRVLRDRGNKVLLEELGGDPFGVRSLPPLAALAPRPDLARWVLEEIAAQGYLGERPWLFKDPKLCLLWPVWRRAFPTARWIVVRRPAADVVASCLRTPFLSYHSRDPTFWEEFVGHYQARLDALTLSGVWWRELTPQHLFAGDLTELEAVVHELGLDWDPGASRAFLLPAAWHG